MGLFNKEQVVRLNKIGINVNENIDYTIQEKKNITYKLTDYIYSHSTKNNDIPNLQKEFSDIINIL